MSTEDRVDEAGTAAGPAGTKLAVAAPRVRASNAEIHNVSATRGMVFVFPDSGSDWQGRAVELLNSQPEFAAQLRLCDAAFAEFVDWSLFDVVQGDADAPGTDRVDVLQPTLFAVMVSLAAQWRKVGIRPDAVLGHSAGEIAAAYVAGALSLQDAAKVVTSCSRAIGSIAGTGGMISISRPVEWVCALIRPWSQSVSVAAQNGPSATVVAGNPAELDQLMAVCERNQVPANRLPVDYASHSAQVEALRDTMRESLSGLQPGTSEIAFISSLTGAALDTSILDADYWFASLRQPVLFEQAVRWSYEHGFRTFIEASPVSALEASIQQSLGSYNADSCTSGTARIHEDAMRRFLASTAEAHRGVRSSRQRL